MKMQYGASVSGMSPGGRKDRSLACVVHGAAVVGEDVGYVVVFASGHDASPQVGRHTAVDGNDAVFAEVERETSTMSPRESAGWTPTEPGARLA